MGDSLGLPAEGMSADRIARRWPGPLRHRLLFGTGMVSDDTEHAVMTALSLTRHPADHTSFARDLGWRLQWWFAAVPAGVGLATARSALKLWCGVPPHRSGVMSAGNGPTMRAPVIGVHFANDPSARLAFADASTRLTHRDPRAVEAARMVAEAASMAAAGVTSPEAVLEALEQQVESNEMKVRFPLLREALAAGSDVRSFADRFGRKSGFVSGFAPDTTAAALFAWLRHRGDFPATVQAVIAAGGDTDTVAFVAASLAGIDAGVEGMPRDWIAGLRDWPLSARRLSSSEDLSGFRFPNWPLAVGRNGIFLAVVLAHGFRRLLPPY